MRRIPKRDAMYLGAHISISESIALAPSRGRSVGCETIQIFSRSPRLLRKTKPIPLEEAQAFQENMKKHGLARAVIHANYLINLASPKKNGLRYSRAAFVEELDRAQVLGIRDVIFHPGAHLGKGEAYALKTIAASLDWSLDHSEAPDVFAVLEITAGQGSVVGYTFAQLAEIMKACSHPERLAVCIDTCHTFAAGYDFLCGKDTTLCCGTSRGPWGCRAFERFTSTTRRATWARGPTATWTSGKENWAKTRSGSW